MHKPCTEEEFIKKFNESICSGASIEADQDYCSGLDEILRDHNTSDYWDPHQCSKSCQNPSYGCPACTNPDYFQCMKNNQSVCIHPDLHCNHHPDCDDAEDEKFDDCKVKYVENLIVKEFATLRCQSKIYPSMETVATVCDDIMECDIGEDEPGSCKDNKGNIFLSISVGFILTIYLGLTFFFSCCFKKQTSREERLDEYKLNSKKNDETSLRQKLHSLCLHVKYFYDKKARKKIGLKIFAFEESHNKYEAMVFASLHNNWLPEVAGLVIDAKYPGFVDKHLSFIHDISDYFKLLERFHSVTLLIGNLGKGSF